MRSPVLAAHWAKPVVALTQTVYSGGVVSATSLWCDAIFRAMLETKSEISVRRPILQDIENSASVWLVAHASHSKGRDDVTLETVTTTRYAGNRCIVATQVLADFGWTIGWIGAAYGRN